MKRILNTLIFLLIFSSTLAFAEQNWQITTGCSGGITGGGSGFTIISDGKIYQWQAPTTTASSKKLLGEIECGVADALRSKLETISFRGIVFSESSNITCSLTLRESLLEHKVAWPVGGPFPPQGVMDTFHEIEALGKRHAQQP